MRATRRGRRRGITVIEMMVASFLMVFMALLLANTWVVFGRSALSTLARARIAQEANLAAAALADDVGLLARPPDNWTDHRYMKILPSSDGSSISFTIDDGTGPTPLISYARDPNDGSRLVRSDHSAPPGTGRVVATLVSGFQAESKSLTLPDNSVISGVQIDLTFSHRTYDRDPDGNTRGDHTRQFTLFVPDYQP